MLAQFGVYTVCNVLCVLCTSTVASEIVPHFRCRLWILIGKAILLQYVCVCWKGRGGEGKNILLLYCLCTFYESISFVISPPWQRVIN